MRRIEEIVMPKDPHSLVPLADFKAVLGVDDRDDCLSRYCLVTATYTIEQYCHRRFLKKRRSELLDFFGDYVMPLRDYPVREILAVYLINPFKKPELVEPDFYHIIPDCEDFEDIPYCLSVSPGLNMAPGEEAIKIHYQAGYEPGKVPADLASACLELAAWNMTRYREKRIGITGNVRGSGKDGEHLEASIPENVRCLLEPYRRRVI
jgi:hypothetical protein